MENITFQTNEQLWKIENAAASAGYKKTNDCYWAQIFRNEETGHEFSTSREEWLDTQARALYQACNRVSRLYRSIMTA